MCSAQNRNTSYLIATAQEALRALNSGNNLRNPKKKDNEAVETFHVTPEVADFLRTILTKVAAGQPIGVIPSDAELTTQQAADLLSVSRPHVVKLMNEGVLKGYKVGTHRRLHAADVQEYKNKREIQQRETANELTAFSKNWDFMNE